MAVVPSPLARGTPWQLDDHSMQRLAQELAREMYTLPEIFARFNLDAEIFYRRIRHNPSFIKHYQTAHALWHSSASTTERIQNKAQAVFEDWLAEADTLFHDKAQSLPGKVELLKVMAKIGKLDGGDQRGSAVAPGDRVLVQINLQNAGQPPIVIDKVAPSFQAVPLEVTHQ